MRRRSERSSTRAVPARGEDRQPAGRPHIVVVHDFGFDAGHGPYLVMEFLHGQSLRERLAASSRPLPLKAGLQLAGEVVLAYGHAHGGNRPPRHQAGQRLSAQPVGGATAARVLDFGIARIYKGDDGKAETITHAGVLGTPRYMSPEQARRAAVDARSDIYSTALLLYGSLTGQLPYLHGKRLTEFVPGRLAGDGG
ncbi:MAG: protein kinase [Gemmataceae bacterium]